MLTIYGLNYYWDTGGYKKQIRMSLIGNSPENANKECVVLCAAVFVGAPAVAIWTNRLQRGSRPHAAPTTKPGASPG